MQNLKRIYVGKSSSGKSCECMKIAKTHHDGITMVFARMPVFKKKKAELKDSGFILCDAKDLMDLDPEEALIISIILTIQVVVSAVIIVKRIEAGKSPWFAITISCLIAMMIMSSPIILGELAENVHYKVSLIPSAAVLDSIINGTEIVKIDISEEPQKKSHISISDGEDPEQKDDSSIGIYFDGKPDTNYLFTVKFLFRGIEILLHTIDVKGEKADGDY